MSDTSHRYLIKILSGPHQGAEVDIDDGEISIGSSLECDLVLSDTLIAPNHLHLILKNGEITIVPLENKTYLDGHIIDNTPHVINAYQYVTLGTTHLAIGPADETWPTLTPPAITDLKDTPKDNNLSTVENHTEVNEETASTTAPAETPKTEVHQKKKKLSPKIPYFIPIAAGVVMLLGIIFVYYSFFTVSSEYNTAFITPKEALSLQDDIQSTLQSKGIDPKLFKIEYKENSLFIVGVVQTNKEKHELESALRSINPYFKLNIKAEENVVVACRDLLLSLNASVNVTSSSSGIVRISGYLPNESTWEKAKKSLLADTPGLQDIIDEVITPKSIRDRTTPILNKYQLAQQITLTAQSNGVTAQGRLADTSRQVWYEAKTEIERALGPNVPFIDKVGLASAGERIYLDAKIESVTITESLKWMSLQNNKTYFEGSLIPSGYIIERIAREGVTLKKGREYVTLKIGEQ